MMWLDCQPNRGHTFRDQICEPRGVVFSSRDAAKGSRGAGEPGKCLQSRLFIEASAFHSISKEIKIKTGYKQPTNQDVKKY